MVMILREILFLQALENDQFFPDLNQRWAPCVSKTPPAEEIQASVVCARDEVHKVPIP